MLPAEKNIVSSVAVYVKLFILIIYDTKRLKAIEFSIILKNAINHSFVMLVKEQYNYKHSTNITHMTT